MNEKQNIRLAYYADDFTGSTDALEFMSRAGAKTMLFMETPSPDMLKKFPDLDAIGIAGTSRAMTKVEMKKELLHSFSGLNELQPRHVHYKVCSTFDSSPEIGNIGTAIDCGAEVFKNTFTPLLVAAPHLGRYSAFGNLYARMGIGSKGKIYRLDRHPSMMKHPITPAHESDLRLHLSQQTDHSMGLIDLTDLSLNMEEIQQKINTEIANHKSIIFFDAMYDEQMAGIGSILDNRVEKNRPFFSVGSSGIEKALGDYWSNKGLLKKRENWQTPAKCGQLLVLSGSVSPISAEQINWALDQGFEEVQVTVDAIKDESSQNVFEEKYAQEMLFHLKNGKSVILNTAKGPEDKRLEETKFWFSEMGWDQHTMRSQSAQRFGTLLGKTARRVLDQFPLKRMVIAGGDTSGFAALALGIKAVEMIAPLYTGAPLCNAFAPGSPADGMEINLKGGQVGDETYYGKLKEGKV